MFSDLSALPKGQQSRLSIPDAPALKGHHATIVEKSAQSTAVSFGFPIDTIRSSEDWDGTVVSSLILWRAPQFKLISL